MKRVLDDWIASYLESTENTEPCKLFRTWSAVATIAAVLQRKCWLKWQKYIFPNMYIILIGPSGVSRKTTALMQAVPFIEHSEVPLAANEITRERLAERLAESSFTETEGSKHLTHCSLTAICSELAVFLGFNDNRLLANLTDWYDCFDRWEKETKFSGKDYIYNLYFNMFGAATPIYLHEMLPSTSIGGGFTSRVIFVYSAHKGKTVVDPLATEKSDERLKALLRMDLMRIKEMKGPFMPDEDWIELWKEWYGEHGTENPLEHSYFHGYASRRQDHLQKLCIILSAARSEDMRLTRKHLEDAMDLLFATEKYMPEVFRGYGGSAVIGVTQQIIDYVRKHRRVAASEIHSKFFHEADGRTIDDIIEHMCKMKAVKKTIAADDVYLDSLI